MIVREKDILYYQDELYHFGVKGMKWGVRRKRISEMSNKELRKGSKITKSGSARKSIKTSSDYDRSREIKKKHMNEMSNEELRVLNERMNLERNYKQLNPSAINKGMKYLSTGVALTGGVLAMYNNSNKLIKLGKQFMK